MARKRHLGEDILRLLCEIEVNLHGGVGDQHRPNLGNMLTRLRFVRRTEPPRVSRRLICLSYAAIFFAVNAA